MGPPKGKTCFMGENDYQLGGIDSKEKGKKENETKSRKQLHEQAFLKKKKKTICLVQ